MWQRSWPRSKTADLENYTVCYASNLHSKREQLTRSHYRSPRLYQEGYNLRSIGNVLYITAKREQTEALRMVYYRTRLLNIDKIRVLLAILVKEEEEKGDKGEGKTTYENGIVTLKIMMPKSTNIIQ